VRVGTSRGIAAQGVTETTIAPLPDGIALRVVCVRAAVFVAFGFFVDGPERVLRGLLQVTTTAQQQAAGTGFQMAPMGGSV
jgi:hypothetical protein